MLRNEIWWPSRPSPSDHQLILKIHSSQDLRSDFDRRKKSFELRSQVKKFSESISIFILQYDVF
jgi:hypothetical protein